MLFENEAILIVLIFLTFHRLDKYILFPYYQISNQPCYPLRRLRISSPKALLYSLPALAALIVFLVVLRIFKAVPSPGTNPNPDSMAPHPFFFRFDHFLFKRLLFFLLYTYHLSLHIIHQDISSRIILLFPFRFYSYAATTLALVLLYRMPPPRSCVSRELSSEFY